MDKYVLLVIFINVINRATSTRTITAGYYWRDYESERPADALPGGLDKNGRPIYIGQVLYENKLIPGKIYENDNKIYFEWNQKELSATNNVKILCTLYPEKFEWISIKPDQIATLTNKLLIKGGYEQNYFTYIGRVLAAGETSVGKVICRATDCLGLYITREGKGTEYREIFEILTYDPNMNVTDECKCSVPIDVRFE